jgi:hypothetical protein
MGYAPRMHPVACLLLGEILWKANNIILKCVNESKNQTLKKVICSIIGVLYVV